VRCPRNVRVIGSLLVPRGASGERSFAMVPAAPRSRNRPSAIRQQRRSRAKGCAAHEQPSGTFSAQPQIGYSFRGSARKCARFSNAPQARLFSACPERRQLTPERRDRGAIASRTIPTRTAAGLRRSIREPDGSSPARRSEQHLIQQLKLPAQGRSLVSCPKSHTTDPAHLHDRLFNAHEGGHATQVLCSAVPTR